MQYKLTPVKLYTCIFYPESKQQPDTAVVGSKRKRSAADEEADSTSPNKVAKTTVDETKKEVKGGSQSKTKLKLDLAESQRANVRKVIKIIKVCCLLH